MEVEIDIDFFGFQNNFFLLPFRGKIILKRNDDVSRFLFAKITGQSNFLILQKRFKTITKRLLTQPKS